MRVHAHPTRTCAVRTPHAGEDLKRQVARLIERDPVWPPNTPAGGAAGGGAGGAGGPGAEQRTSARPARAQPSSGRTEVAASALELFRMLQVRGQRAVPCN